MRVVPRRIKLRTWRAVPSKGTWSGQRSGRANELGVVAIYEDRQNGRRKTTGNSVSHVPGAQRNGADGRAVNFTPLVGDRLAAMMRLGGGSIRGLAVVMFARCFVNDHPLLPGRRRNRRGVGGREQSGLEQGDDEKYDRKRRAKPRRSNKSHCQERQHQKPSTTVRAICQATAAVDLPFATKCDSGSARRISGVSQPGGHRFLPTKSI